MKITQSEIRERICSFAQYAVFMDECNNNEAVLGWLFLIEFYKDLLITVKKGK
jgi:hypothetical protein